MTKFNIILMIFVFLPFLNASRLLYFPLTKLHQSANKPSNTDLVTHDQYSKRHILDWETLINEEAKALKRLLALREHSSGYYKDDNDFFDPLDRHTRKPKKTKIDDDDEIDTVVNQLSQPKENRWVTEPLVAEPITARSERLQADTITNVFDRKKQRNDTLFLVIVGVCSLVGVLGLVAAAMFWYKIQKRAEAAIDSEYPSYGITGPHGGNTRISPSSTMSDRKLAQSAQMFHYQQQRQQMMAQEKAHLDPNPIQSDDSDDEETPAGGDYTVYECPGLAPTGEMEVRNPLFAEPDSSFSSVTSPLHPTTNSHYPQMSNSTPSSSPPKEKSLS